MPLKLFTDGACLGNPGPGGWAALIQEGGSERSLSGREAQTTNNRMELEAVIQGLDALEPKTLLTVYTDSQYVKNGITLWMKSWETNGWRTSQKKPVKNQDLWLRLKSAESRHRKITWQWVKGHSGHRENTIVDELAQKAARQLCVPA